MDKHIHHKSVLPNGQRIKEIGLSAWLEEQKQRWSCTQCGKLFTWFEEKCQSCQAELFNVHAEFGIKNADYIIDLGPEGGRIVACGTPEEVSQLS